MYRCSTRTSSTWATRPSASINSKLETVTDWQEPFKKGVIYYLEHGRVRGVLLWNVWKQVDNARLLLAAPGPFTADELMAGDGSVKKPSGPVLER